MWDYEDAIIIREIYEGECPEETFERELDRALEAGCKQIVIEPARLGEETARWIRVGDCLHKCTILFGLSSICLSITPYHSCSRLAIPFTMGSVFCGGLYMICWQSDPCCKYRLARITEFSRPGSTSYIDGVLLFNGDYDIISNQILVPRTILLRKDQDNRKYIQTAIVTVALALAVIRFYT